MSGVCVIDGLLEIHVNGLRHYSQRRLTIPELKTMRIIILIWLLALIYCLLIPKPAHAGTNFTKVTDSITFLDLAYQYPLTREERAAKERLEIVKKQIERQFEEAKKASASVLSKEQIEKILADAIEVLRGATIICKSEVIE